MSKHKIRVPAKGGIKLDGAAEVSAVYADIFVVATEKETNMASIYFFQTQVTMPDFETGLRTSEIKRSAANCVGRIVLAPKGMEVLLGALAENRGYTLTKG